MLQVGSVIGQHYSIEALLGQGGMSSVYRARHAVLGSEAAIKVLHPHLMSSRDIRERFLSEARIQAQLRHPHIASVRDVISEPGIAALVMDLLEGEDLAHRIAKSAPLGLKESLRWIREILSALSVVHERGIIHRDLKPANVFLERAADGREAVRLVDFGIAQLSQRHQTQAGTVMGTPAYMAPEQIRSASDIDHRADLYAAGVVLYEMLTGRLPFDGSTDFEIQQQSLAGRHRPLRELRPDLPAELADLIARTIAPDPTARFPSAGAFAAALGAFSSGEEGLIARPSTAPPRLQLVAAALEVELNPCITLAGWQNRIPIVRSVTVENRSAGALESVEVEIRMDPPVMEPWTQRIEAIPPGSRYPLTRVDLRPALERLRAQVERERVNVAVEVRASGSPVAAWQGEVDLLAPNQWPGARMLPELLAAFVLPNHPALQPILKRASDILQKNTNDPSLAGYQDRSPLRVKRIVQALYLAVQNAGVTYVNPPASFEEWGQKIRLPDQVLGGGQGTCLDLTVLLAGLMEQVGLHPFLVVVKGHAFPGVWLTEFSLPTPIVDDPAPIRKRVELQEALIFDSSSLAQRVPFSEAVQAACNYFRIPEDFRFAVDVRQARQGQILPLSLAVQTRAETSDSPESDEPATDLGNDGAYAPLIDAEVPQRTRSRLERWKGQLLDLSLRNRLLNFQVRAKAIELPGLDLPSLFVALSAGQALELHSRPELVYRGDPRDLERQGEELHRTYVRQEQQGGRLRTSEAPAELRNQLLELYRQDRTSVQETGAITLYLTLGMLRWYEDDASEQERLAPLVLLPIELQRSAGEQPWKVRLAGEEPQINTTLLKKLERDFGLNTAGLEAMPEAPPGSEKDPTAPFRLVLQRFRKLVLGKKRWDVLDRCCIARFSFTKFLMWRDLDARTEALLSNPVVRHIIEAKAGAFPLSKPLVPESEIDRMRPAASVLTVLDADPSQLQAIFAAEDGSSFVLQGPPGTGKSQTITNMISQILAQGRTVLFVSEKMAALDVVYSRLKRVGLGAFCLQLHAHDASKREVIQQLGEVFQQRGSRDAQAWQRHTQQLEDARSRLNSFAALLGRLTAFEETTQAALSRLIAWRDAPWFPLQLGDADAVSRDRLAALRGHVAQLLRTCEEAGSPAAHPWSVCRHTRWIPTWERNVETALDTLGPATADLLAATTAFCEAFSLPTADLSPRRVGRLAELARQLRDSPAPPRGLVYGGSHAENTQRIAEWTSHVQERQSRWASLSSRYNEQLLRSDLTSLQQHFQKWATAFFLLAFLMLWSSRQALMAAARQGRLPDNRQLTGDLGTALAVRREDETLTRVEPEARSLLGRLWRGADTDVGQVNAVVAAAGELRRIIREVTEDLPDPGVAAGLAELASDQHESLLPETRRGQTLRAFLERWERWGRAQEALGGLLGWGGDAGWVADRPLNQLPAQLQAWRQKTALLRDWCALRGALDAAAAEGLAPLTDALESGTLAPPALQAAFERSFYQWWWEETLEREPTLREFRSQEHQALIDRFRQLDQESQVLAREEVRARLLSRVPDRNAPGQEMALLRRQMEMKTRHLPLRQLFQQLPGTLRRLKPCLLMSPLSVAQYLDLSQERFDVVIFDEASQIPPWDALGAIARGKQVIVVGDSRQLPPTDFFSSAGESEEDVDEEGMQEMESILQEAAVALPEMDLRWHYRSRHESLIAFSNHKYYENRLNTFPTAAQRVPGLGVELRPVPKGYYDRGRSRSNEAEARAVVAELKAILSAPAERRPSVGIVTFSMAQQRKVEDLVDQLRQQHPELEPFFTAAVPEPAFIKNLENVQGDERDVMLFSIGYGPDREGKVGMNFGPLNRQGGERRLNVAVTRARERLAVFSTLRADQIDLRRTRAIGAAHLKTFLDYAARGMIALDGERTFNPDAKPESPLEQAVKSRLEAAGWAVHAQVGCSGYRIDLGVVDPEAPGRYLLGVECDGATYHSSRCARERDRLRQAVLESLGWRIHRIWSTDWWLDPEAQMERLERALEEARTTPAASTAPRAPEPPLPPVPQPVEDPEEAGEELALLPDDTEVYRLPTLEPQGTPESFYELSSRHRIGAGLKTVVQSAGPIHRDEAFRIVCGAWGMSRLGKQIQSNLLAAWKLLPASEKPSLRGDFFWPVGVQPETWRSFRVSEPGAPQRKPEAIPAEEIANAALWVLESAKVLSVQDLAAATGRLLGFKQARGRMVQEMTRGVEVLVSSGRARREGDVVHAHD